MTRIGEAEGQAFNATVSVGPPATPEQEQAIREQDAANAAADAARREAKLRAREGNG